MKLSDYQKSIKESIAASPQNDEYYLQKLDDIFNNKERFSFNFAAACFGSLWCIYRKMYGLAAITALIKTILLIVIPLAISRPIHGAMVVAVEIAISLFLGFTGNLFYYKFISKKQKEIKPDYYSAVLKKWKLLVYLFIIATTLTLIFGFRFIFVIPMCQAIQQCPQEKLELYFFVMGCICIPTLIMSLWGLVASHSRRFNLNEKTLNDYQKSIRPHVSCNKEALS
ncbi:MAG: DUF2628 domain-containing protein, partial [Holosporaceae bacterium]|nr:DUF2628 domain-containing protein [Holosporaceae bacterium]